MLKKLGLRVQSLDLIAGNPVHFEGLLLLLKVALELAQCALQLGREVDLLWLWLMHLENSVFFAIFTVLIIKRKDDET